MSPIQGRRPLGASSRAPRRSRLGTSNYSLHSHEPIRMDLDDPPQTTHLPRPHSATAHWLDANQSAQAALDSTHAALMRSQQEPGFYHRSGGGSSHWPLHQPAGLSGGSSNFTHQPHSSHPSLGASGHDLYHQTSHVDPLELLTAATELPHAFAAAKVASDMIHSSHRRIPSDSLSSQQLMHITNPQEGCSPTSGYPQGAHPLNSPRLHHETRCDSLIPQRQASGPLQADARPRPGQHDADWQGVHCSSKDGRPGGNGNGNPRPVRASRRASPPADADDFSEPERRAFGGTARHSHGKTDPDQAADPRIAGEQHAHILGSGRSCLVYKKAWIKHTMQRKHQQQQAQTSAALPQKRCATRAFGALSHNDSVPEPVHV